jgi:hypothetical protein
MSKNNIKNNEIKVKEHFDENNIKNACHFACSNINYTTIIILIVAIIFIYHIIVKYCL